MEQWTCAGADGLYVLAGDAMIDVPEWIRELSREDRNRIDNGIHPAFDTWKLHHQINAIQQTIDYLRDSHVAEPSSTTLVLIEQLEAHAELIEDRIDQIERRKAEWRAWRPSNRECIHGVVRGCDACHEFAAEPALARGSTR